MPFTVVIQATVVRQYVTRYHMTYLQFPSSSVAWQVWLPRRYRSFWQPVRFLPGVSPAVPETRQIGPKC